MRAKIVLPRMIELVLWQDARKHENEVKMYQKHESCMRANNDKRNEYTMRANMVQLNRK